MTEIAENTTPFTLTCSERFQDQAWLGFVLDRRMSRNRTEEPKPHTRKSEARRPDAIAR
jgi:hypothetical protein